MANQTKRVAKKTLAEDKASIEACAKITTYAPVKAMYNQAALDAANSALALAEAALTQAVAANLAARDNMVAAQWNRHNLVLGMRQEIKTQFGDSSNELQSVGLKKKSEYKAHKIRKAKA